MIEASQQDQGAILGAISDDAFNCLYLYLDVYHYGIGSDGVQVWCEPDQTSKNTYSLIAMKFGDSMQLYSPHDCFNQAEVYALAQQHKVARIHARKSTIELLKPVFGDTWEAHFGRIFEKTRTRNLSSQHADVVQLGLDDVEETAALILTAEEFAESYTFDDMVRTLTNIIESGMGACFGIRRDGRLVATQSITATSDLFMITSYLVTHPDYQNALYGSIIESYVSHEVRGDKHLYTMVTEPRRAKLLELLGNPVVAEYGKLVQSSL